MEERLIDNEREIKIKRRRGGDDVVDALAEDGQAEEEEELVLELPEEYDEDLVGLTPTQLKEELARREKARKEAIAECEKYTAAGEEALSAGKFGEAAPLFSQALLYDAENVRAGKGLWQARTKNYTETEAFYSADNARRFAASPEEVRSSVLDRMGEQLKAEREEYAREAEPLQKKVEEAQAERRGPFLANKRYYQTRTVGFLAGAIAFIIGLIVAASFIYSTLSILPVVFTGVLGGLAAISLVIVIVYAQKLVAANRLCRANEQLSSTEDGARLELLNNRLACLGEIFGE